MVVGMKITALLHDCSLDGETGYCASCVEFPEANGQGETMEECLEDLRAAVREVIEYRRETATKSLGRGERLEALTA
jgi:predicted RNase H-like HicB family nuclease